MAIQIWTILIPSRDFSVVKWPKKITRKIFKGVVFERVREVNKIPIKLRLLQRVYHSVYFCLIALNLWRIK